MSRFMVRVLTVVVASVVIQVGAFAASITVHDVYQTAASGHVQEALTMMDQVLAEHPNSAQAHFVEAELLARSGEKERARSEFSKARQLNPALTFAKPSAVQALQMQLYGSTGERVANDTRESNAQASSFHFPWGAAIMFGLLILSVVLFVRSIRQRAAIQQGPSAFGNAPTNYGPGYMPNGPGVGGGMGSSILGGLATGAAVGAGLVAGEALANHFIDGHDGHSSGNLPHSNADGLSNVNHDMGGSDFGINDSSSWDAGSSGDFGGDLGGGGDWG